MPLLKAVIEPQRVYKDAGRSPADQSVEGHYQYEGEACDTDERYAEEHALHVRILAPHCGIVRTNLPAHGHNMRGEIASNLVKPEGEGDMAALRL
jgi:hypothetical protein